MAGYQKRVFEHKILGIEKLSSVANFAWCRYCPIGVAKIPDNITEAMGKSTKANFLML